MLRGQIPATSELNNSVNIERADMCVVPFDSSHVSDPNGITQYIISILIEDLEIAMRRDLAGTRSLISIDGAAALTHRTTMAPTPLGTEKQQLAAVLALLK